MVEKNCVWEYLFDDDSRESLYIGFFIGGIISIALGLWINAGILMTKLRVDRSYRNLANFTLSAFVRRIVGVLTHVLFINYTEGSDSELISCRLFAFLETFLAVYEVEWLTHVCIERYVIAKYNTNGWPINENHYKLYENLCIFFASLYSVLPLFGIGRYGFDLSCNSCTFDMILPDAWPKYFVVTIFALRSIKPVVFMFLMLFWARLLERKYVASEENSKQQKFTQNMVVVTIVNLICWTPIATIRGIIVLQQIIYSSQTYLIPDSVVIKWAFWVHWISPTVTVITLLTLDKQIRQNMINILSKQEKDEEKGHNGEKEKML